MTKVMIFGTFDIVHEGHKFAIREAASYGDELYVVIALDSTVRKVKEREPYYSQDERCEHIRALPEVTKVLLGNTGDKYKVVEDVAPDVIALGYDQVHFVDKLEEECITRGLTPKIVKLSAHHPEKFKSSIFRAQMEQEKTSNE